MEYQELIRFMEHVGKDPSRLIFEDELTGIHNRRFLLNYLQSKVSWGTPEAQQLSLIMMDVDHFKDINDTYGHQVGDQALVWVSNILKEVTGEEGMPIRYAGDEFMVLLPFFDKAPAMEMSRRLLDRLHEKPFVAEELDSPLAITLSMGVASAPEDAQQEKALIHKADTALYYAKKTGRDRAANASDVVLEDVLAKTALYQLEATKLVGRRQQLVKVNAAIKKFSQRKSQFLIVQGAGGMGKTEFLATLHRGLARSKVPQVKVRGNEQEMYRPYYLTTNILMQVLSDRKDKGGDIFEGLSEEELSCLSLVLPQPGDAGKATKEKTENEQHEAILSTLVSFFPKVVNNRPLILLVDDMHLCDEATLILLHRLMQSEKFPIFVCGTFLETDESEAKDEMVPLERFYQASREELGIDKLSLSPLNHSDIANHIGQLFPGVGLPEGFSKKLAAVTQGNPLFLGEILRNLISDQKITLAGQQWVIQPVKEDYFPKSLEELVSQRIESLDDESRQLLDQVSTFGEDVSLSALTGASEGMEAQVLDFVDKAVAQGLLTTDFHLNDETIRFLSKRVLQIAYGAIQEGRKQQLHERIGNYQETLYQQDLLPSAAPLAYHFSHSANQEKATKYEQVLVASNSKIFSPVVATSPEPEQQDKALAEDAPLDDASMASVPTVIRHLLTSVRNLKLYPSDSKCITISSGRLSKFIDEILEKNEYLSLVLTKQVLVVNGQKVDVSGFTFVYEAFVNFLRQAELKGIAFHRGLSRHELDVLLEALSHSKDQTTDQHFWKNFSAEHRLTHIDLKQMRYTLKVELDDPSPDMGAARQEDIAAQRAVSSQLVAGEHRLDQQDLADIPQVVRCILSAARTVRLYPENSRAISNSAGQTLHALSGILRRRPVLSLASVKNSLFINGEKIDTSDFEALAKKFFQVFGSIQLASLTFLANVSTNEIETFIGELGKIPPQGVDSGFWNRFGKENGLSCILFNQHDYDTSVVPTLADSAEVQTVMVQSQGSTLVGQGYGAGVDPALAYSGKTQTVMVQSGHGPPVQHAYAHAVAPEPKDQVAEPVPAELFEAFVEDIPEQMSDLLLKGDEDKTTYMLRRLFQELQRRNPANREKVIHVCRRSLDSLPTALQHQLAKLVAGPILSFFTQEKDPKIIMEIAPLLHRMATTLIEFGEYPVASRFLLHLQMRHEEFQESRNPNVRQFAEILDRNLEPAAERLVVQDLKSDQPAQRSNAALLLSSLGRVVLPLVIDIIKTEDELRVRKIAVGVLEDLGPRGAELLKRALVLEITPQERVRILQVIDTLTCDLKSELAIFMGDDDPEVRKAAFELAERINDSYVAELLLSYAKHPEPSLATAAIKTLGRLKIRSAAEVLVSVLNSTKDETRLVACCRALGQIADPGCIEPMAKLLAQRRLTGFFRRHSVQVRAAAAFALANTPHPGAIEVLEGFVEDRDPNIREIARSAVNNPEPL